MNDVTVVPEYNGLSLQEVTEHLTIKQKQYMFLRLMGAGVHDALKQSGSAVSMAKNWRCSNERFAEVEAYLLGNSEAYCKQAAQEFISRLGINAQLVLEQLLEKGRDWDTIDAADKKYVMEAVKLVTQMYRPADTGSTKHYEEFLLQYKRVTVE